MKNTPLSLISIVLMVLLASCSKSDPELNSTSTTGCLLTEIKVIGSTVTTTCTITYNSSGVITKVSCSYPDRTNETNTVYEYTYSPNSVTIKTTITDLSGTESYTNMITLKNSLPTQIQSNGIVYGKFVYEGSQLRYFQRFGVDSTVFQYDASKRNIIGRMIYTKSLGNLGDKNWSISYTENYKFDTNPNPLKGLFLEGGDDVPIEFFNTNNIIEANSGSLVYIYNSKNLPVRVIENGKVPIIYSYSCK